MDNCEAVEAVEACSNPDREVKRVTSNASRKESFRRRNGYGKADRVNLDDIFGVEDNRESSLIFKKNLLEAIDYDSVSMKATVATELKDMGIEIDITNQRQSRSKTRKMTASTPGNSIQASVGGEQFLETVEVKLEGDLPVRLCIPTIVKQTCEFIRKEIHVEGIFRKSGLSSRITSLKQRFHEKVEDVFGPDDTVFDATSALKQYLRELSSPLIPFETHASFLKCLECEDEKNKVEAVLTCVYLLPLVNIHVLVYLMQFLHDVMDHAVTNKMGHKNIALVITPNIMPLEEKKHISKGKETIISEKMALEKNRRVVEILILYGDHVGWVPSRLFKALEVQFIYRNSDDELEERGRSGRRKKRRSGSLTRMFGFFRKVTRGDHTPSSTIDTPNGYSHTPIMKSSKKRASDEPMFSVQKKKTILDAVRKNGLKAGCDSPDGFLTCPSPAVCLNPSPMKPDWSAVTPEVLFATPCLNRQKKRSKSTPETLILPSSSSSKVSAKNMRLGFGRKSGKKVAGSTNSLACEEWSSPESMLACSSSPSAKSCNAILNISKYLKQFTLLPSRSLKQSVSLGSRLYSAETKESALAKTNTSVSCSVIPSSNNPAMLHQQVQQNLFRINHEATMSIHHLPQSPRRRGAGVVSIPVEIPIVPATIPLPDIGIPPPPEFCDPPEHYMDSSGDTCEKKSVDEGEYVMIPRNMSLHDVRNEAFVEPYESSEHEKDHVGLEDIKLTPLIKEIDKLTMKAREEEESYRESAKEDVPPVAQPLAEVSNLPERRCVLRSDSTKSSSVEEVAKEFRRVVNEEKLIKLKAEIAAAERAGSKQSGICRRGSMSIAARGVSPSKRRINSFRRRSFDTSKPPGSSFSQSPKFMSLRSPRSRPAPPSLTRSPTRCTLRRGRPNTARAGLSRPSPAKGSTSTTTSTAKPELPPRRPVTTGAGNVVKAQRSLTQITQQSKPATAATTRSPIIRRMSSVQELVSKLEKKGKGSRSAIDVVLDSQKLQRPSSLCLRSSTRRSLPVSTSFRMEDDSKPAPTQKVKTPVSNTLKNETSKASTPNQGSEWTDGAEFTFGKSPTVATTPVVGNRESIHFLKTKNAGKVSANIKMFDGIAKQDPLGPRSMIPRYTALHTIHSQRSLHSPTDE